MSQVTPQWTPPPPVYYGYPQRPTNGLAIAAMVVSLVGMAGLCAWGPLSIFVSPVGAIMGHVARRKIKQSDQQGDGMAVTGIIVGWLGFVLALLTAAAFVAFFIWMGNLPREEYYYDVMM